ncbi:MAG: FAD-binding oxidoreductase [Actinomycetes bacterium]
MTTLQPTGDWDGTTFAHEAFSFVTERPEDAAVITVRSAHQARAAANGAVVDRWPLRLDDVVLAVHELVTNALRAAGRAELATWTDGRTPSSRCPMTAPGCPTRCAARPTEPRRRGRPRAVAGAEPRRRRVGRAAQDGHRHPAVLRLLTSHLDASVRRRDSPGEGDNAVEGGYGMTSATIERLRAAMAGEVLVAGDEGYDEARRVWNADVDRRPAVIARCTTTGDVAAALRHAVEHGLEVAVRGGAHSISGMSVVDDGLMVDLSRLNAVTVDAAARRARVGGGALLGDVLAASQEHGLALPVGAISHTGVGGLTLGGGMGWLTRKHGLTIDNLVSAEVVLADGRVVRASAREHPDLFWAIRGGGGNFGVVTEFELALHPVGPMIEFGMMFWGLDQGSDVLRAARDVVGSLPDGVNVVMAALNAPPAPFVPEQHHHQPGYAAVVVGFHGEQEHRAVLERFRAAVAPLWEVATPMPYLALQHMLDEPNAWGNWYYDKGLYLDDLSDAAIEAFVEHVPRKSSPLSVVLLYRLDGAYSEVDDDATAFSGGRSPRYNVFIIADAPVPELLEADRTWVRALHDALAPHSGVEGTYVNALRGEESEDRVRAAYGSAKYERLARIKRDYDPANLFHRNANIVPAAAAPGQRSPVEEHQVVTAQ